MPRLLAAPRPYHEAVRDDGVTTKGRLLVATPSLGDPNFDRTVVLLAAHGDEGALGFVVNRRAQLRLGQVLGLAGIDADDAARPAPSSSAAPSSPARAGCSARIW